MPFLPLLILAVVAMIAIVVLRLVRVHFGRTPLPDGRGRRLFFLAFLVVPPLALGALIQPASATDQLRGVSYVFVYGGMLAGITGLMWAAALLVRRFVPGRSRLPLLLALIGHEADRDDIPANPPVTTQLAASLALVDRANAVFPRGREFPAQVDRTGFRSFWDALDAATLTLEGQIADDHRLGLGVAHTATVTATDARSRLTTLRSLAVGQGQAWAGA